METLKKASSYLDAKLNKFISRKLFILLAGSGFFYFDKLGQDNWTYIALVYIGVQGLVDGWVEWKKG